MNSKKQTHKSDSIAQLITQKFSGVDQKLNSIYGELDSLKQEVDSLGDNSKVLVKKVDGLSSQLEVNAKEIKEGFDMVFDGLDAIGLRLDKDINPRLEQLEKKYSPTN